MNVRDARVYLGLQLYRMLVSPHKGRGYKTSAMHLNRQCGEINSALSVEPQSWGSLPARVGNPCRKGTNSGSSLRLVILQAQHHSWTTKTRLTTQDRMILLGTSFECHL